MCVKLKQFYERLGWSVRLFCKPGFALSSMQGFTCLFFTHFCLASLPH